MLEVGAESVGDTRCTLSELSPRTIVMVPEAYWSMKRTKSRDLEFTWSFGSVGFSVCKYI